MQGPGTLASIHEIVYTRGAVQIHGPHQYTGMAPDGAYAHALCPSGPTRWYLHKSHTTSPQVHVHTAWYSHAKVPTLRICWSKYTPRAESQDQLRPQTPGKPAQPKARGAGALQAKGERGKGLSEEGLGNPAQNRDSPTQCSATIQRGLKG